MITKKCHKIAINADNIDISVLTLLTHILRHSSSRTDKQFPNHSLRARGRGRFRPSRNASTISILPRIFHDVIASISMDWEECGEAGGGALCNMINVASLSHRLSNLIIGLHSIAVLFYCIGVVALRDADRGDVERELFLKMDLPFESDASPIYELVMTTQFLHQMTSATVIGVLSALLVTLVSRHLLSGTFAWPTPRGISSNPTEITSGNEIPVGGRGSSGRDSPGPRTFPRFTVIVDDGLFEGRRSREKIYSREIDSESAATPRDYLSTVSTRHFARSYRVISD